ncbi:proton myo-inositol cotransporter-like [Tubulanus polymorphus]|uniref:proton myo-inositol cotransporter-like n=1 Tax=Tubulanus polymorphus TaxID=672921 RepID=UPI003DA60A63
MQPNSETKPVTPVTANNEHTQQYDEDYQFKMDQIKRYPKTPTFVYVLTVLSGLGGFLFGYDTGVISGAIILLRDEFVLNSVWQEMIVSMTIGAAAVFAILGGLLNDRIGRKPVILMASIIFTAGAICLSISKDRYLLLAGRIIIGAAIGLSSMTVPIYIAESAPPQIRGRLVSCNVAMIACGQFVANVIDGIFSFNKETGWRYMLGLAALPSAAQFIGFLFLPESPRWLIIQDKEDKARRVLHEIRGEEDIEEEFESIKNNCLEAERERRERSMKSPIIVQMILTPSIRRSLVIGCSLQMFQQLAGINTVMYYSATIIKMSGVKSEMTAIWLSAVTAAVNFMFTFVGLYLVEKIGRRLLTLGSLMGAIISLIWLAVGFQLAAFNSPRINSWENIEGSQCGAYSTCDDCMRDLYCGYCYMDENRGPVNASCLPTTYDDPLKATSGRCNSTYLPGDLTWAYEYCPTAYSWMAMVGLVLYLVFFAPGMGPMPWTINSEIYPLWARSTGNAVSTFTNWLFNLIVSMTFLTSTEALTRHGTFWLYACLAMVGFSVLFFLLPETKGKTLEEVEGLFARPWFGKGSSKLTSYAEKSIQYVHIRGLNRDGRDSELDSPE